MSLSLTEQLEHLSAAGHLLFVLYRANRTSFCPGQLYYNIETFIKNAFWSVAKTYLLDALASFHLIQCGDDRLENIFAILRAMGNSSNGNFSVL